MNMEKFTKFFADLSDGKNPHHWQQELCDISECSDRLIRIPTGFGKTLGVLATWIWHRVRQRKEDWPRRLIWCLPTRVLVEQTEAEVRSVLQRLGVLWDGKNIHDHDGKVGVHVLMGGVDASQWHLYPECDAVLIGTQDMLLSRAMNRGYACPRARWPMEFGLLNQDALWVMDEVQLMDVGLATSGQLQAFRNEDRGASKSLQPCFTWWMSATLQRSWLEKSPDTDSLSRQLLQNTNRIRPEGRNGHLWDDVTKTLEVVSFTNSKTLAQNIAQRHKGRGFGEEGPTLVVLNTVDRAVDVWKALRSDKVLQSDTEIYLVHSRFRPAERKTWRDEFLNRAACSPGTNRIIVSTQVIEAGVDISAPLLVTELAPWTSLIQRFGRCARWSGSGQVIVVDFEHKDDKQTAPYPMAELAASRKACDQLRDVGPIHLERFEDENEALIPHLYPYEPQHLLLRNELNELFDTTSDLSGSDIDISRFIRSGDERDVQVFWIDGIEDCPQSSIRASRDELCSVPFVKARDWLCKKNLENLKLNVQAWVWDWLSREWREVTRRDIFPGQTVLVKSNVGGYRRDRGWDPSSNEPVEPVRMDDDISYMCRSCWKQNSDGWFSSKKRVRMLPPEDHADAAEDDESLSITNAWQTIASHGLQVGKTVERIASQVVPSQTKLLHLAGRWHDVGKAHPAFQASIQAENRPIRDDIAKAPDIAWPCNLRNMYRIDEIDHRCGFRHELASTLGLFGVLQRHDPDHQALLGPWGEWFETIGEEKKAEGSSASGDSDCGDGSNAPTPVEQEILNLGAQEFDLLAYLVCSHHGKVRMAWHASRADQEANDSQLRIRGVRQGDILPPLPLAAVDGGIHSLPATALDLAPSEIGLSLRTGRSWSERVIDLVDRFGPFTLAWLETILRAADQRASKQIITDKLLQEQDNKNAGQQLERSHQALAQSVGGGASESASGSDSQACRQLHGDGRRTGRRGMDSGTTRPPYSATRYIETSAGILSYQKLAPLLAERVADTELAISNRTFAELSIHSLLLELHRRICRDLTTNIAGRWRLRDVHVGKHQAPPHRQVPMQMKNYAADVEARLEYLSDSFGEQLFTDLTFAEGQLLHIHPFEDFNGHATRLFLIELLYRLNLPVVNPATSSLEDTDCYFAALDAYDRHDPRPLFVIWQNRFAQESP